MTLKPGFRAVDLSTLTALLWTGTVWRTDADAPSGDRHVARIGVGALPATGQSLTVEGQGALLNTAADDMRLTINRQGSADVGSVLFQTGFAATAEFGLVGDDRLSLRCFDTNGQASEKMFVGPNVEGVESAAFRSLTIHVAQD